TAFLLRQAVDLGLELGVRRNRAGLRKHLPALDLLALRSAKEAAHVVACLAIVEQLAEHLDSGDDRLRRFGMNADELDLVADVDLPLLDSPGCDSAAAGDRENVLDRHQERLVEVALGLRDVIVERVGELEDRLLGFIVTLE